MKKLLLLLPIILIGMSITAYAISDQEEYNIIMIQIEQLENRLNYLDNKSGTLTEALENLQTKSHNIERQLENINHEEMFIYKIIEFKQYQRDLLLGQNYLYAAPAPHYTTPIYITSLLVN